MEQKWLVIQVSVPWDMADAASEMLVSLTGRGILEDQANGSADTTGLTGYLQNSPEAEAQKIRIIGGLEALAQRLELKTPEVNLSGLDEQDWSAGWKKHFKPKEIIPGLVVAPAWEEYRAKDGETALIIDPGQAFGTGHHQTTTLILARLRELKLKQMIPSKVLDVGCGTGILAMAALKWGAKSALCLDIDPLAVEITNANAEINGLKERMRAVEEPLSEVKQAFPLVLANITALDLKNLSRDLAGCLARDGELVASGMLIPQMDDVAETFAGLGLKVTGRSEDAEWGSLVLAWA